MHAEFLRRLRPSGTLRKSHQRLGPTTYTRMNMAYPHFHQAAAFFFAQYCRIIYNTIELGVRIVLLAAVFNPRDCRQLQIVPIGLRQGSSRLRNLVLNELSRAATQRELSAGDALHDIVCERLQPPYQLAQVQQRRRLQAAL